MNLDEVESKIKEAIQSQQPVWLGVWADIAGDYPVWLTLGNKPAQSVAGYCKKIESLIVEIDRLKAATNPPAQPAQPLTQQDFEGFVKDELGDVAVKNDGRYISPKIQNYWKIWQHSNLPAAHGIEGEA
jgi:hypothetical protein